MGSVYKKHGIWVVSFELASTSDGKRRRRVISCPELTRKSDAQAYLADILRQQRLGTFVEPSRLTLVDYLDTWLDSLEGLGRSPATIRTYAQRLTDHVVPTLGAIPLSSLQPAEIDKLFTRLRKSGLGPRTVREVYGTLHAALRRAVRLRLITANPADMVEPPTYHPPSIRATDAGGLHRIIDAASSTSWHVPVLFACLMGLRRGEICGLRWEDYDAQGQLLLVRRSIVRGDEGHVVKGTKTGRERALRVPVVLQRELREAHKAAIAQGSQCTWICPSADGSYLRPSSLTRAFRRISTRAGCPISCHAARHSYATLLIEDGIPVMAVSEALGHSNTTTTVREYAHSLPHMAEQSRATIERIFPAADEAQSE